MSDWEVTDNAVTDEKGRQVGYVWRNKSEPGTYRIQLIDPLAWHGGTLTVYSVDTDQENQQD